MWNPKNKQTEFKQTHRYRKRTDSCQREGGLGDPVKMMKGLRSTNWSLENSHGDVKHRNIDNVDGVRWVM